MYSVTTRFNRYIVECKVYSKVTQDTVCPDLIDTLWNVKGSVRASKITDGIDLIDTLWNVKTSFLVNISSSGTDLIDTLWNVKA